MKRGNHGKYTYYGDNLRAAFNAQGIDEKEIISRG